MQHVRIDPVDVLFFRGNKLFGDAAHSEALMPPWPSVFAGALRSRMLADEQAIELFARNELPAHLKDCLGTHEAPGRFRIAHVGLLTPSREFVLPLPSDLVVTERAGKPTLQRARPRALSEFGMESSSPLGAVPVVQLRDKPKGGYWLTAGGFETYQEGKVPADSSLVKTSVLWEEEFRLGIGLDAEARTAKEGLIYTSQAVAMKPGVGFVVGVAGADGVLPTSGLLRLGGDGRGASVGAWTPQAENARVPWRFLPSSDRFAVVLATPGLFAGGWELPGMEKASGGYEWAVGGLRARLVAASIPRFEIVSGWDVKEWKPKPAVRVAPRGSVYWFERTAGELNQLEVLLEEGLWPLVSNREVSEQKKRRAEGYNNVWFSAWEQEE